MAASDISFFIVLRLLSSQENNTARLLQ